jgi:hypothetical protein
VRTHSSIIGILILHALVDNQILHGCSSCLVQAHYAVTLQATRTNTPHCNTHCDSQFELCCRYGSDFDYTTTLPDAATGQLHHWFR